MNCSYETSGVGICNLVRTCIFLSLELHIIPLEASLRGQGVAKFVFGRLEGVTGTLDWRGALRTIEEVFLVEALAVVDLFGKCSACSARSESN